MKRTPSSKPKHTLKTFNNLKITLLCGFVTILVLRGTIGMGLLRLPSYYDSPDLRKDFSSHREANRVLTAITDDQDDDKSKNEDDMEDVWIDPTVPYRLGPKVSNWDRQRHDWLSQHPEFNENDKLNVMVVTGSPPSPCENPAGDHYLLKSLKNKLDYCRLHDIKIFYNMVNMNIEMAGYWSKLPILRRVMLAHPEIEWLWWMDSDAMFTDMSFVPPFNKYKEHNLILHGWEDDVYNKKAWVGLNTGSFLVRNCQWSLDLIDTWALMGPKGKLREDAGKLLSETLFSRPPFEADDQSSLVYLLVTQKDLWGDKVFLENSYYLHGYWINIVDTFEEVMQNSHPGFGDERWPFVTHFVGCKTCASSGDYSVQRCLKQMERSFNFADNQIIKKYGFIHNSLDRSTVKKTANEMVPAQYSLDSHATPSLQ